jgi:hypothetical protein
MSPGWAVVPSGAMGAVPATATRLPMRTAREKPMGFSKGEPDEMFWRMAGFLLFKLRTLSTQNFEVIIFGEEPIIKVPNNLFFGCSFSSTWKKTNQKKTPMFRGPSGSPALRESGRSL